MKQFLWGPVKTTKNRSSALQISSKNRRKKLMLYKDFVPTFKNADNFDFKTGPGNNVK